MSFQYARNAKPESFLTNWLHWLSDMFVTVRIGKIFWLMSLRRKSDDTRTGGDGTGFIKHLY